ncbi:MAG: 6-carboxytetrahydropterin synthase [Opitutales bacterium]|jgi:6-pyruvoyltetrahydropterin/6-carboxytetrahydropterin synthase
MLTCSKTYRDIPLSHRQPRHPGRCSRIHGHSWSITLTFGADEADEYGFIVDFGELHYLSDWIDEHLDHATMVASDDPRLDELQTLSDSGLLKLSLVHNASCEGIAKHLFETFDPMVAENTDGRAHLVSVELHEDSRNSALYRP